MIYRKFGKMGWKVSAIGQGLWNIGNQWGEMSDEYAEKIVRTAYENGVNIFDVAEVYGDPHGLSEIRLGKAIKGIRNNIYIVSKIGNWGNRTGQIIPKTTSDMIRISGHAIAGRLRTDYIDGVLCHEGDIESPKIEIYIEGFEILQKEGFIREYGISTDRLDVLKKFYEISKGNCKIVETEYNLINSWAEKDFLPYCQEKGIAVLVKRPIVSGILSGKYTKETVFNDMVRRKWNIGEKGRDEFEKNLEKVEKIKSALPDGRNLIETALKFSISHTSNPIAIPGATSPQQVLQNVKLGESILLADEINRIKNAIGI